MLAAGDADAPDLNAVLVDLAVNAGGVALFSSLFSRQLSALHAHTAQKCAMLLHSALASSCFLHSCPCPVLEAVSPGDTHLECVPLTTPSTLECILSYNLYMKFCSVPHQKPTTAVPCTVLYILSDSDLPSSNFSALPNTIAKRCSLVECPTPDPELQFQLHFLYPQGRTGGPER